MILAAPVVVMETSKVVGAGLKKTADEHNSNVKRWANADTDVAGEMEKTAINEIIPPPETVTPVMHSRQTGKSQTLDALVVSF